MATARTRKPKPADVCRLSLTIAGTMYHVRPLALDDPDDVRAYRLRKADGTVYHVLQNAMTGHQCDCGDFTFRRDGKDPAGCKHVRALVAVGLFDRTAVPEPEPVDPQLESWRAERFAAEFI